MLRYELRQRAPDQATLTSRVSGKPTGITVDRWGGWVWDHRREDGVVVTYFTNREGEGLFADFYNGQGPQQLSGTSQFCLPRDRAATLRKLRRLGLAPTNA